MPAMQWRQVQVQDESWQLEVEDETFVAEKSADHAVDGWRPLVAVWKYTYGVGDRIPPLTIGEEARGRTLPTPSMTPWRTHVLSEGPKGPRRDFATLIEAQQFSERQTS